jgi:hypothetical protein
MALAMLALSSWTATAQDRLVVGSREVGAIGHFGADLAPAPALVQYPRFGGDRYVHVPNSGIHDVRTGAILPVPSGFTLAYDRARPRVFVGRADGIWGVDVVTGLSTRAIPRPFFDATTCVHATSADVLLCAFARPDGQRDIVRSGPTGAVMVATTRFGNPLDDQWLATPDGSRVYLDHCRLAIGAPPGTCVERGLALIEVATGAVSTAGQIDVLADARLVWDEVNDRLFVVSQRVDVFTRDLVAVGSAETSGRCRELAVSPHTGRIYLNEHFYYFSVQSARLSAYDARTLRRVDAAGERVTHAACSIQLLTAPGAPRDVRASVAGRNLTLSWTNIGAASSFVLDVGFAPGRTNLSLHLDSTPFAIFQDVPPGTYYLRLRGGNIHGGGRPSAEVAVTVR